MGVSQEVQFAVAEMFWSYMKKLDLFPETRTKLSKVYGYFKLNLFDKFQRRVNFSSALFSLRNIGVVKWPRRKDKETIIYNEKGRKVPASENLPKELNEVINIAAVAGLAQLGDKLKKIVDNKVDLSRDRGNITIKPLSEEGVVDLGVAQVGEEKEVKFIVTNESDRKYIFGSVVLGSTSDFNVDNARYEFMGKELGNLAELPGKQNAKIPVTIKEFFPGIFHVIVAFWFRSGKGDPFHIVKFVKIDFIDDVVKELEPTVLYVKQKPLKFDRDVECVKGEPLQMQNVDYKVGLKRYLVPRQLREYWKSKTAQIYLETLISPSNVEKEHCDRLSALLHIEELQMEEDIQQYNMKKAKLSPVTQGRLALTVPGLMENRPSLIRGDRLFVRELQADGTQEKREYEGFVHHVERDAVHLKFSPQFHHSFIKKMSFAVRFSFRRTPLQIMHRALEQAPSYLKIISPIQLGEYAESAVSVTPCRFYNLNVGHNEEQSQAVENIVAGTSRPYPYLVFGPPGTGKTVTMVEAINQVLYKFPDSRILACAPSNSAADLMLERVAQQKIVPSSKMVRLNALGRSKAAVNPKVMEFCKMDGDDCFYFPSREEIMEYRFVVTTLSSAGRLISLGVNYSHFTHVFIDEAGQGMEPESLVPIAGLLGVDENNNGGQLVLAGDPKQLGPVLRSRLAIQCGLGTSFLERLMGPKFACYNRTLDEVTLDPIGPYNTKMVTKLLNNYRSHPDIIKVPNEWFYDDELRACADVLVRESLCQWEGLPVKGFPVVFEGVKGDAKREKTSPSFFNPHEVSAVLRYVQSLKGNKVATKDIGIISPYNKQVQKIREKLRGRPYDIRDIKVGSVEEFQGQERRVIIVSTVRSSKEFLYWDSASKIGFLNMPKRFNVAITRAKALLIVIGNPHVLCRDKYWRKFIGFCMDNGSYLGCAFELPDIDEEVLASQLNDLKLEGDVDNSARSEDEDPAWKPPEA